MTEVLSCGDSMMVANQIGWWGDVELQRRQRRTEMWPRAACLRGLGHDAAVGRTTTTTDPLLLVDVAESSSS